MARRCKRPGLLSVLYVAATKRICLLSKRADNLPDTQENVTEMIPTSIIRVWFLGLFSWVLLGAGIYFGHKWHQRAWSYDLISSAPTSTPALDIIMRRFF